MGLVRIPLKSMRTPNFMLPVDESKTSIPVSQVSRETLESMCEDFRVELLRKAGYQAERRDTNG